MATCASIELLDVEESPFSAEDYVQMACQLRRSAEMNIRYPDGRRGGIVVNKGELWHAWDNLGDGDGAFLRMVGNARVTNIRALSASSRNTRTTSESCQKLLLQAVIARDTNALSTHSEPPANREGDVDSELTRPDWPTPRAHRPISDVIPPLCGSEPEATTTRSNTERPVALSAHRSVRPRSLATFLRQPVLLQRGLVALFAAILLGSVAQILASPGGGNRLGLANANAALPQQNRNDVFRSRAAAIAPRADLERSTEPPEVIFQVSALETVHSMPPRAVFTRVHNVSATGAVDASLVARHVVSSTAQFATCHDWASARSLNQIGLGDVTVVVDIDAQGSVLSASSRGGKLQGLNTCVAQIGERLATLLPQRLGPSRLVWTVTYQGQGAGAPEVNSEIH